MQSGNETNDVDSLKGGPAKTGLAGPATPPLRQSFRYPIGTSCVFANNCACRHICMNPWIIFRTSGVLPNNCTCAGTGRVFVVDNNEFISIATYST